MAEGNGLELSVGPVKMEATGDRSLQAALFIALMAMVLFSTWLELQDHEKIRKSIDQLTIATLTSDEDKKSAIGTNLREELKEEIRKTAEQAVKKGKGD